MRSGKRMLAGILAAVMMLSSVQFSGSVSYAEELPQSAQENTLEDGAAERGDALQQEPEKEQDRETKQEPGEEQDGETEKEPEEEQGGETETEDTEQSEAAEGETGETDVELPKDGESVSENDLLISGNTLMSVDEPEIWEQAEGDGIYQFGGAPSGDGEIAPYSVSAYTDEEVMGYLYQQMKMRVERVDISKYRLDASSVRNLFGSVLNENPDLYYVGRGYSYAVNDGYVSQLVFTYSDAYDDALFYSEVGKALAAAGGCTSDLQKAIVLHDWLTVNCEYDYENYEAGTLSEESYSAYGVFVNRTAVCQGYALAYKYLLNQVGIDCYMVTSDAMNHAWNMIKLNGQYYQVDVTWDDPVMDVIGRSFHWYMFLSDAAFQGEHHDWRVTYGSQTVNCQATDTRYDNAFWTDCESPLVLSGDDCYYIASNGGAGGKPALMIAGLNAPAADGAVLQEIDYWTTWEGNGYWGGAYSGLFRIGDRLYYNDKAKIYSVALNGADKQPVFTADTTKGYIYASAYCQGKVLYVLRQSPNQEEKDTVLTADIDFGGGQRIYYISYIMDGGKNHSANPSFYTEEDTVITLQDPVRDGYRFEGWYSDAAYTVRVTEIRGADKRDIVLYAKWTYSGEVEGSAVVKAPNITTYKVGQKIDLKGGTITYPSGNGTKTTALAENMISGFDSSKPGICPVKVTAGGYTANFETLIVEEPKLMATVGKRLAELPLPTNEHGVYTWQDDAQTIEKAGVYTFMAAFTPKDETKFQKLSNLRVEVTAQETIGNDTDVTFKTNYFTYNGMEQEPRPIVRSSDTVLKEGQDYELSYENNKNAGQAAVTVSGRGCYLGSITKTFEISPAQLVIAAQDKSILIGDPLPGAADYAYEVRGLLTGDTLAKGPTFSCSITDTKTAGKYEIIPSGAEGGPNYTIPASNYERGILTVAEEAVSCTVTFDTQGQGTAPAAQIGVKVGGMIKKPDDPAAVGYRFDGWYREAACTRVWNFDADIVQEDMTLYAKWMRKGGDEVFALQEIADLYYTGNACKPAVSVYDGDTLLKSGRDYQIKYYNNVNANKDGVLKKGSGTGTDFNAQLPYVEIVGKGNYTDRFKDGSKDTVKVNFNILRASIGDGTENPAKGVTLKVADQLVTAKKVQKPFSSIKYVKAMKRDTDFEVHLTVENARDEEGKSLPQGRELTKAELPKEYAGEFLLTVEGKGNYAGSIQKTIYVTDKTHLMKNTVITLGKDIKNIEFAGEEVRLKAAETNAADVFTVKCGRTFLKPGRDYTAAYRNNDRVGKAELLIIGNGEYVGTKTAAFQIKGKAFSAKTVRVEGVKALEYTGKALTQNNVNLTWYGKDKQDEPLMYGKHYTISYAKNLNKGTATMTFKGVEKNGYSGSFKKSFQITAVDIADPLKVARADSMSNMSFPYCKAGVKPVEEIRLTNKEGIVLQNGKDYTLRYQNNKAVADAQADKPPTVTVQGKGNYSGKFDVTFTVTKRGLKQAVDDGGIQVGTAATAYQPKKGETFAYQPAVKLTDGRTALRANKDYEVAYRNNTQKECKEYLEAYETYKQAVANGNTDSESEKRLQAMMPRAVITAKADSSYLADGEIVVPLQIYRTKLAAKDLEITVAEMIYVGNQVTGEQQPVITVKVKGEGGAVLVPGQDYTISYGANNKSGRNAGSVTITGIAPRYGGSVTKRFEIVKKPITY